MQVGDVVAGRYRLVRLIGRGGMGVVFEAVDQRLGDRSVALKFLKAPNSDPGFAVRFQREAEALARLDSPHIVTIYDNGSEGDGLFLVTELVPDGDLRTWIQEHGPFAPLTAVRICEQLCEALSDAHEQRIIHRDVKPANVLLRRRRGELWAYLADFGIARKDTEDLTRSGAVVGSVSYMAPERHLGHEADERSDVYSLGCVLWAMLAGHAPYSGTDFQVMVAHVEEPVPELADTVVGRDLIAPVLDRMLAKRPEDRIASAEEARWVLAALAARLSIVSGAQDAPVVAPAVAPAEKPQLTLVPTVPAEPDPPAVAEVAVDPEPPRKHRRRAALVAAAVVVLVAAVAVGGVLAAGDDDTSGDAADPGPSASTSTSDPAPPPSAPTVEHQPAYRGVEYAVAPVDGATLEVRRDGKWVDLPEATFTERVPQGGDKVCLSFRAVSVADGVAGDSREVCDRAVAPTIAWKRTDLPCTTDQGLACAYYDIDVAGFRSGARLPVSWRTLGGRVLCGAGCLRPVTIGNDGRARVDGSERVDGRPGALVVVPAGDATRYTFVISVGDRSVQTRQPVR